MAQFSTVRTGAITQGRGTTSALAGDEASVTRKVLRKTGIADNTATTVFTITIPNVTTAAMINVKYITFFDAGATTHASARVSQQMIAVTRRVNVAAVAAILPLEGSATNPVTNVNQLVVSTIATLSGENTLTTALSLGAVTGAATVSETVAVQITNVANTGTATTEVMALVEVINSDTGGVTVAE